MKSRHHFRVYPYRRVVAAVALHESREFEIESEKEALETPDER